MNSREQKNFRNSHTQKSRIRKESGRQHNTTSGQDNTTQFRSFCSWSAREGKPKHGAPSQFLQQILTNGPLAFGLFLFLVCPCVTSLFASMSSLAFAALHSHPMPMPISSSTISLVAWARKERICADGCVLAS